MKKSYCCIFNLAAHYRAPIYKLMDKELNCDFYIGDRVFNPIKKMDYSELYGFKKNLKFTPIMGGFYWQKGAVQLVFKKIYSHFILIGEPHCISTWLILIFAKILNKETFVWTHGWYGRENILKKVLKKIFFSLSTKVLLYGDYAKKLMEKEGFKKNKMICIYNSLDYDKQISIRKKLKSSEIYLNYFRNEAPVILYIGRIQKVKKLDLLIESINKLNDRGSNCNLIIIGEKSEEISFLNNIIGNERNIWLYGPCYDENKIGELIFNASVCVSPGNVGLTAMHSLVYGTPIITHDNFSNQMPEFEAITEGLTGSFFKEDSLESLCLNIEKWIGFSDKKRDFVRNNCYRIIDEKYNPHVQIEIFKKLLK
ncbi:Glycosyltransferase involved in cell wall bisynthesis [Lutibacter agarilyticus]|uniref:Glycosyltransferase involved in cell wall bisynthesis n=1 Tax=Lutibacter agarilyticus TaxID=1109740 RepID=A0A238YUB0_9FLAO|nr:glycosyltransferase family 4 protein [Lutibacter agarilyticus]SNR74650.1 Glycosyltransferase involved in cell wall bisynthesis [Lutibacter agarilyticus]